ncbi:hypothetical protein L1987_84650 [Smallanthus sonchifolius]|uniref:Uncharacterized protein n=1 Tax=Smallanthus sonchifolius TaxID=185202 RepID=A0ACB8XVE6_9ASTR|nr:hypothetical protein L1987_84650 [Smallanthus sonchifolius]
MSSLLPLPSSFTPFPPTNTRAFNGFKVSCNHAPHDDNNKQPKLILPNVDRRELLVGLGGLYTTAANLTSLPSALADPIQLPDDFLSSKITLTASAAKLKSIVHSEGSYVDEDNNDIGLHHTWLFFPFHRWYLYFYERILGNLIGRPDFALPYWNWDDPDGGMEFPEIFLTQYINGDPNPLYDVYRDAEHVKEGSIVDLNWSRGKDDSDLKACNLYTVYRELYETEVTVVVSLGDMPMADP